MQRDISQYHESHPDATEQECFRNTVLLVLVP